MRTHHVQGKVYSGQLKSPCNLRAQPPAPNFFMLAISTIQMLWLELVKFGTVTYMTSRCISMGQRLPIQGCKTPPRSHIFDTYCIPTQKLLNAEPIKFQYQEYI